MHWLLLLAVLSSSTSLKNGGSSSSMNRLAEQALRRQLGGNNAVRSVRVLVSPGKNGRGDFNSFDVSLDGFSADKLMNLSSQNDGNASHNDEQNAPQDSSDNADYDLGFAPMKLPSSTRSAQLKAPNFVLGDIFKNTKIDGALGDLFGMNKGGRIGKLTLHATNFSFGGARYSSLQANLGEIRFDWLKALSGKFDVKSVQPGTLGLQLQADQAVRLLSPRLPSIQNLSVRFAQGRAFIGGKSNWYGVRVPFEVGAQLSVQQNQVRAANFSASVARVRLPSLVIDQLTRSVNPLYDFDPKNKWPLTVNLQTAATQNNAMTMRGGLKWRGFNASRN